MLQQNSFVNIKILFIKDGSFENPDYIYDITKQEIKRLSLKLNIFEGRWYVTTIISDNAHIFSGNPLHAFKGYVWIQSYGSSPEKMGNHYPLRIVDAKRINNSSLFEVTAEDEMHYILSKDVNRISLPKDSILKNAIKKVTSSYKELTKIELILKENKTTPFKLPIDFYYTGNLPKFLKEEILPYLENISIFYFSGYKLYIQNLNIKEKPIFKFFNFSKREGRKDSDSDYMFSEWFHSLIVKNKMDTYFVEHYNKLDLLNATNSKVKYNNKKYTLTDPYLSRLNLKDEVDYQIFNGLEATINKNFYNSIINKYLNNTIDVVLNVNPYIVPNIVAEIDTSIKNGKELEDTNYRGKCFIYEVEHQFELTKEETPKLEGNTIARCIKSGFYAGEKVTIHSFNTYNNQPDSSYYDI